MHYLCSVHISQTLQWLVMPVPRTGRDRGLVSDSDIITKYEIEKITQKQVGGSYMIPLGFGTSYSAEMS